MAKCLFSARFLSLSYAMRSHACLWNHYGDCLEQTVINLSLWHLTTHHKYQIMEGWLYEDCTEMVWLYALIDMILCESVARKLEANWQRYKILWGVERVLNEDSSMLVCCALIIKWCLISRDTWNLTLWRCTIMRCTISRLYILDMRSIIVRYDLWKFAMFSQRRNFPKVLR